MKKQNPKEDHKKELEGLLSKSAALREQHQTTSERMDEIRKKTVEFLKTGNEGEPDEDNPD